MLYIEVMKDGASSYDPAFEAEAPSAFQAAQDRIGAKVRPSLEWRRLRQFLSAYERRSLGQAAAELNITQPALSKSLRALEDELDVKLFERTPLGVVPTAFGDALAIHAKVIQAELCHAQTQMALLRGGSKGRVTAGIGPSIANFLMPDATARLRAEKPDVSVTVREGLAEELVAALRCGEIEVAIGTWPWIDDADLTLEVIYSDQLRVFVGHDHALAGKTASLEDLLDHPWALPPKDQRWRTRLSDVFMSRGLPVPSAAVESNSSTYLRSLVCGGDFLTFVPRQSVLHELQSGRVMQVDVPELTLRTDVTMMYRSRATLSPAARALINAVRDAGREIQPGH